VYIEVLGKIDLDAMYKITTQERLLQNLVYEYERFADPRLVSPFWVESHYSLLARGKLEN
jgi:hypothetical protein